MACFFCSDYNTLRQEQQQSERQLATTRSELETIKMTLQTVQNEKMSLAQSCEQLQDKVSNLEMNNSVLREAGKLLDEQIEDYEKVLDEQTIKIKALTQEW